MQPGKVCLVSRNFLVDLAFGQTKGMHASFAGCSLKDGRLFSQSRCFADQHYG